MRLALAVVAILFFLPIFLIVAVSGGGDSSADGVCGPVALGQPLSDGGPLTAEMTTNATTIVEVGQKLGVPELGQVIALSTALVESRLINVDSGDRDSVGLFQQRPSQGWGTVAEIMNPAYAATRFYMALSAIPVWTELDPGMVAQAVQRSAFPDRYGERMADAAGIFAAVTDTECEIDPSGELATVTTPSGEQITVAAEIAGPLDQLLQAAHTDGVVLGGWGWRGPDQQIDLRRKHCGTSDYAIYEMASSQCNPPTARPGHSMHEKGLAVDFTCDGGSVSRGGHCDRWLMDNAPSYGLHNLPSEAWHYSTNGR